VPPGDEEALAAAIATLLTDQTLAGRLAAAGRERVSAHFTAAAMLDRMEQTLCDAATGGSTG
jgi:glycosyltransferase involved in cell wall biosynthesis